MATNPCPFDGYATPPIIQASSNNNGQAVYYVTCPLCRVQTPDFSSLANAETFWNTRSESAGVPAWDAAVTDYQGTSPASLVSYQGATYVGVAPVTASAPGAVGGEWMLTT